MKVRRSSNRSSKKCVFYPQHIVMLSSSIRIELKSKKGRGKSLINLAVVAHLNDFISFHFISTAMAMYFILISLSSSSCTDSLSNNTLTLIAALLQYLNLSSVCFFHINYTRKILFILIPIFFVNFFYILFPHSKVLGSTFCHAATAHKF